LGISRGGEGLWGILGGEPVSVYVHVAKQSYLAVLYRIFDKWIRLFNPSIINKDKERLIYEGSYDS
jgi:hypothetical protein